MKIIIIGGTLNSTNLGVCALESGAVKVIRSCFPGSEVIIMDYARQPDNFKLYVEGEYIDVELVNIRFSKKIYLDNNIANLILLALLIKLIRFKWFKDYIYRNNSYLKLIFDSDFVVSIAGGDSFSDIYGVGRYLYVFLPQLLSIMMNKDIYHIPQTFGPFRRSYVRASAKYILKRSKYIYSREYFGVEEIKRLISTQRSDQKIGFCYDFGFVLDPVSPRELGIEGQLMDYNNLR